MGLVLMSYQNSLLVLVLRLYCSLNILFSEQLAIPSPSITL